LFCIENRYSESALRKWIDKIYRPAGFILLGTLFGAGLTLAVQGKLPTPAMVGGVVFLLGLGILVVRGRRNRALFFLAICLLWAGDAVSFWMSSGKLINAIFLTLSASMYAISAWVEYGEQRKKRAEEAMG
jgi:hypothetical protein